MSKKNDLIKNTMVIALGKVSTQLISFFLLPLYTFFLTPGEYGVVDLIITYVTLLVPAITLQLEMAAFRFLVDIRKDEVQKRNVISNILQIVVSVLVVCVGILLVVNAFVDIPYAKAVLLTIIAMIFSNLFLQIARGVGDNMKFAIASIVTGITTLIGSIVMIVMMGMGAEGMLLSIALANVVCSVYLFFALKIYNYMSIRSHDKALKKELIAYSFPLVPNGVSWWVINVSDRTIISIIIGVAANGIYAVANKFSAIFTSVFSIFAMSWTEAASVHINDKDRDKFFSDTMNASTKLFGSLGLVLIAFMPLVFNLLISANYTDAYLYIPILIVAAFFNAIVGLYSAIYIAKKMTKQVANSSIIAALISISLTLIFIHFIGLYAAAIATAIAYLAMSIYRHYDVKKYVTITYEKNIFLILGVLYAFTMILYYYNNTIGNIMNAIIITIAVVLLNKSIIKVLKNKVFSLAGRRKKLTPEQQASEELL